MLSALGRQRRGRSPSLPLVGAVSFEYAEFSGGTVIFQFAEFSGATVNFAYTKFSGAEIWL
jgi:hypothetical protein